jgi:PBP1b-binding outer membrane lipoprotein LpoB
MKRTAPLACLLLAAFAAPTLMVTGCGKTVTRTDQNAVIDLSGDWNDVDSTQTAQAMIADATSKPWADNFRAKKNKNPTVKVGRITVRTNGDIINTDIFTNDLLRAFINSDKVDVVGSSSATEQTRAERADQDKNASEATRKESFQEQGSDFLLTGSIGVQDDQDGGKKVKFYSVDLTLIDVQSQRQVWIGNKKIKKFIER